MSVPQKPYWLKQSLGRVADIIGKNGKVEIVINSEERIVNLSLIKENGSVLVLPASGNLSAAIRSKQVSLSDIKNYEVLELSIGTVCVSNQVIEIKEPKNFDPKDFEF